MARLQSEIGTNYFFELRIFGHNLNQWANRRSNFQCFPNFIVRNDPEKPPHLVRGFLTFQCFVFFLVFAFSCLSFSSFPLLLDFLKPKSGPSNEVIGEFSYEECSEISPEMFEPLFSGSEKIHKIPTKFPTKVPCKKQEIHRRASAGAQGNMETWDPRKDRFQK